MQNYSQDITYNDKHFLITVPDGSVQIAERIDPMPKVTNSYPNLTSAVVAFNMLPMPHYAGVCSRTR